MRTGDLWFITNYIEYKGKIYNLDRVNTYLKVINIIDKYFLLDDDSSLN